MKFPVLVPVPAGVVTLILPGGRAGGHRRRDLDRRVHGEGSGGAVEGNGRRPREVGSVDRHARAGQAARGREAGDRGATVKLLALVAVPAGVVTVILPVVAPAGTVAVI